ncbi:unnamed protein product [Arabis nemorensis]|uniref:HSF-type DNA-binding domain-containing protein n=1 Tax=Arabis nemorensis TaxID=586526 RepID=A0A565CC35_9BRAS|nr:unnamed protein product [Arabis nemorensis]
MEKQKEQIVCINGTEHKDSSSPEAETVTVNGEQTVITDTTVTTGVGGSSDSSSSYVESLKPDDAVNLPSVGLPKATEGLREMGPMPFLRKTFEIVDDAVTDPVVSWSPTRKSFIVWDSYIFSENLLPKYFKHRNFSSFVRQLNTYGFRKVDSDRWEFANEGFQQGKKHLLKNIKRRSKINYNKDASTTGLGLESETEVESLKEEQSSMSLEIFKLKKQQEESHQQMITVEEKIHGVESKQQHMLGFFAKLAKDQRFVERLMKKRKLKQQRELEAAEFVKKLKLLQDQETQENLPDVESEIFREELAMAVTQLNPESDIINNYKDMTTSCQLKAEELLGSKTIVDVNVREDSKRI